MCPLPPLLGSMGTIAYGNLLLACGPWVHRGPAGTLRAPRSSASQSLAGIAQKTAPSVTGSARRVSGQGPCGWEPPTPIPLAGDFGETHLNPGRKYAELTGGCADAEAFWSMCSGTCGLQGWSVRGAAWI